MIYPWRSREAHAALEGQEEPLLAAFLARYCAGPREVAYFSELAVEVEP